MLRLVTILALVLAGCTPEHSSPSEEDVIRALIDDFVSTLGNVLLVSRPSDCRTDGETDAPVTADLFAAFLAANAPNSGALDLAAVAPKLRIDASGSSPQALHSRRGQIVVALSRVGMVADLALACVEVFATEERAFFLLLARDGTDHWSLRTELETWRSEAPPTPEELPDGTLYEP